LPDSVFAQQALVSAVGSTDRVLPVDPALLVLGLAKSKDFR
jgi:hypothetical protein